MAGRTVNKAELVEVIAQKADLTKVAAGDALEALLAQISGALKRGDKVQIAGFGAFEARWREPRRGRNPQTGEQVDIAGKWAPAFKAGKALKDEVASAEPPAVPCEDVSPPVTPAPPWGAGPA